MSKHLREALPFTRLRVCEGFMAGAIGESEGIARVRLEDGAILLAEVHWYEAHGIGRRDFKIKRYVESSP